MGDHMSMSLGGQRTLTVLQHIHQIHHSSKGIKSRASPMTMNMIVLLERCMLEDGNLRWEKDFGVDALGILIVVVSVV
jgi:hypothetical protein